MAESPQQARVLVLDGDMPHTVCIVRSLARLGATVDVASHEADPLAGYSRHAAQVLRYPDPMSGEAAFLAWAQGLGAGGAYELVIPVTERTLVPFFNAGTAWPRTVLAMAPREALAVALDKRRTTELARSLGIAVPRSRRVTSVEEAQAALGEMRYPAVIKPGRSIGQEGGERRQLAVAYAFSPEELLARTRDYLAYGEVLLQEYVRGEGVGVELIADRGNVVYAFQHRRLHEVPLTGGGSSLRVSTPVAEPLLQASRGLMAALGWHGVAMVEFKWDPADGSFALMEINGRFWGSLPLAVAAGADFPAMLYELMLQDGVRPRPPARPGVLCRKLATDLQWHEEVIRKVAPPALVALPGRWEIVRQALWMFLPRHYFDVQSWRDPGPGLVDLRRVALDYVARGERWWHGRQRRRAQRAAWRHGRVESLLGAARQILFVCYGNINRSALAERCFQRLAPECGIRVISAGFHSETGRPADPVMVQVAGRADIDLRDWASRRVSGDMVAGSDVILVMEQEHYERLCREYPEAAGKTFLLGMAAGECANGEIDDPYGRSPGEYERCAREVMSGIRTLTRMLAAG